jgi:hypothetical protein
MPHPVGEYLTLHWPPDHVLDQTEPGLALGNSVLEICFMLLMFGMKVALMAQTFYQRHFSPYRGLFELLVVG